MDLVLHFPCAYRFQEKASSYFPSMRRSKKGFVCCKKPNSSPSKSNQEEILSLLKRIQTSISKGKSQGAEEKNQDESYEDKPLTKAILNVLEKSRKNTEEGDVSVKEEQPKSRPRFSFTKRDSKPMALGPTGKLPVRKSGKALEEITEKAEKSPLFETMKLAELKEVAKKRGIKGYSKLKKNELLELLR